VSDPRQYILQAIRKNIEDSSEGCILTVKIEEDPSGTYLTIESDDLIFRTNAPIASKGNAALVGYLSRALNVPSSRVDIVYGVREHLKRVLIKDVSCEDVESRLYRVIRVF